MVLPVHDMKPYLLTQPGQPLQKPRQAEVVATRLGLPPPYHHSSCGQTAFDAQAAVLGIHPPADILSYEGWIQVQLQGGLLHLVAVKAESQEERDVLLVVLPSSAAMSSACSVQLYGCHGVLLQLCHLLLQWVTAPQIILAGCQSIPFPFGGAEQARRQSDRQGRQQLQAWWVWAGLCTRLQHMAWQRQSSQGLWLQSCLIKGADYGCVCTAGLHGLACDSG